MTVRKPGDPGYLGPAAEAQREREMIRARSAQPMRPRKTQEDHPGRLFGEAEPSLF